MHRTRGESRRGPSLFPGGPVLNGYNVISPSLSFRVTFIGRCAEGGGNEVPMHVISSYSARFRKWLGQLGKKESAEAP